MNLLFNPDSIDLISLTEKGYSCQNELLTRETITDLNREFDHKLSNSLFRPAAIGHNDNLIKKPEIRGDHIHWLTPDNLSVIEQRLFTTLEKSGEIFRKTLRVAIDHFEAHYAFYEKGAGYARHNDNFQDQQPRLVTMVIYLNNNWQPGDGGELRVFRDDQSWFDVEPHGGTVICFLPHLYDHEVLPSLNQRRSITVWFRREQVPFTL